MPRDETKRTLGGEIKKICCPYLDIIILASPTMHGEELKYITEAYETNWMSTVGKNINEVEKIAAEKAGVNYAVGLSTCTAALHLCVKLAGERLYGKPAISHGALESKRVFCSDMTFDATLNPVVYEGGMPPMEYYYLHKNDKELIANLHTKDYFNFYEIIDFV